MRIIQILPELDIGGVERHVIDLSNELTERGHEVMVISNGGQMQNQLSGKVLHRDLPVHKKNPITAWRCSGEISSWIRQEGWELIHAHSRVPAWIAWRASSKTKIPWIYTAHACYSLNYGLIPLKHAGFVISVSETVQDHINGCLPENFTVIPVALPEPTVRWDSTYRSKNRFIFVGRLTKIKGLDTVIEALGKLRDDNWTLDVLGDGPERQALESLTQKLEISDKVIFRGYSDQVDNFMTNSSCLLFPSHTEGMPLTLVRAVQIGIPVIASNISSVSEMTGSTEGLISAGDISGWRDAIMDFIVTGKATTKIPVSSILTLNRMVDMNESIYSNLTSK